MGVFSKKLSERICSWLFFQDVKSKTTLKPKVELILNASGLKNGKAKRIKINLTADDSFELTAKAVMALLKQYEENYFKRPGFYLMGNVVNETVLFKDTQNIGIALIIEELK